MKLVPHSIRPHIFRLQPYAPGKPIGEAKRELGLGEVVKLASNENPLGPSPLAVAAMASAAQDLHRYPDAAGYELRVALSAKLGLGLDQIILGNGSDELIHLLGLLYLGGAEDQIVVGDPSFVRYDATAGLADSQLKKIPLRNDLSYDLEAMLEAIDPHTRLVFLANPNNPTGTIITLDALNRFLDRLPEGLPVVLDEAYFEFARSDSDYPDAVKLLRSGRYVIGLRTFSKAYGLAGMRLGYGFGPAEVIDAMNRVRQPFNANHLAQVGAIEALRDEAHLTRTIEQTRRSLKIIREAAKAVGATAIPSHANFVLIDLGQPAQPVYESLLAKGVIVRPIGGETMIRVSAGTDEETRRFADALVAVMKEKVTA